MHVKVKCSNGQSIFVGVILHAKICSPICNQKLDFIKNNYDNSKKLKILKHLEGDSVSIDLLIGNDFYYSWIVKGQINEPIALEINLWRFVISGVLLTGRWSKNPINITSTYVLKIPAEQSLFSDNREEIYFVKIWIEWTLGIRKPWFKLFCWRW